MSRSAAFAGQTLARRYSSESGSGRRTPSEGVLDAPDVTGITEPGKPYLERQKEIEAQKKRRGGIKKPTQFSQEPQ